MIDNTPYTDDNIGTNITDEETGIIDTELPEEIPGEIPEEPAEEPTEETDDTPTTYTDEYGEWLVEKSGVKMLINPSQKWIAENPPPEPKPKPEPEPTPDDTTVTWDALAKAYAEGVNSLDQ